MADAKLLLPPSEFSGDGWLTGRVVLLRLASKQAQHWRTAGRTSPKDSFTGGCGRFAVTAATGLVVLASSDPRRLRASTKAAVGLSTTESGTSPTDCPTGGVLKCPGVLDRVTDCPTSGVLCCFGVWAGVAGCEGARFAGVCAGGCSVRAATPATGSVTNTHAASSSAASAPAKEFLARK